MFQDLLQSRVDREELMDLPSTSRAEFEEALTDIQWVNRYLRGADTLIDAVDELVSPLQKREFTVLDMGTGAGDIPIALVQWGQKQGIRFKVTAVDLHPVAVEYARQKTSGFPEIEVIQADALNLPFADGQFDLVVSSMFMHHLNTDEAVRLLQEMARLSRIGFVVNDLERSPLAWLGIRALGAVLRKGRVFRHDAPLSVQRGFQVRDVEELKALCGLPQIAIARKPPYRIVLTWRKPDA